MIIKRRRRGTEGTVLPLALTLDQHITQRAVEKRWECADLGMLSR